MAKKENKEVSEEIKQETKKFAKFTSKNYWMIATISLAVVLLIILSYGSLSGIGKTKAGETVQSLIAEQYNVQITVNNVSIVNQGSLGKMYYVVGEYQGQKVEAYLSKDGKYLVPSIIPVNSVTTTPTVDTNTPTTTEVPKTTKPVADFYVFSYCPYGTQMEKALVPVYNLMKNKADINIVFIGAMHGEYEKTESLRQVCIQKNYGKDKLFAYLDKFLVNAAIGNCQGVDTCVNPLINTIYSQTGISSTTINNCMTKDAEALYNADVQKSSQNGVSGSPTTFINGVSSQVARSPAGILSAICSAFTDDAKPTECSTQLSSTSASAGFGSTGSSSSAASCG